MIDGENTKKFEITKEVPIFSNETSSIDLVEMTVNYNTFLKQFIFLYPSDPEISVESLVQELKQYIESFRELSSLPNAARILSTEILNNTKQKAIYVNLTIENDYIPLKDFISKTKLNFKQIINFLQQSLAFINLAQSHKCVFSDLKIEDFLIDRKENLKYVGYSFPKISSNSKEFFYKNSNLYSAPELLAKSKQPVNVKKINNEIQTSIYNEIVKYQIYSWGIFAYFLIGGQPYIGSVSVDEFKLFPEQYFEFFKAIDSLHIEVNNNTIKNIKSLIKIAIDYNPENRLNFHYLYKLSSNLEETEPKYFDKQKIKYTVKYRKLILKKKEKDKIEKKKSFGYCDFV